LICVAICNKGSRVVEKFFMVVRLQRWVAGLVDKHGIWLHVALLIVFAYFALVWSMHERWWGENFRIHGKQERPVKMPDRWYSQTPFDELDGFKLVGTLTTESGDRIALVTQQGERKFLRTGQALEGTDPWMVVSVDNGAMTLRSGTRTQTLVLTGEPQAAMQKSHRAIRIDLNRRVAGDSFALLHWYQVPMGGNFFGMRLLTPVAKRNAGTFGLIGGDTIESVNGLPITADVPERLLERFRNDDSLTLGVRRQGQLLHFHFSLYD
jgi:hypothetical protein